MNWLRRIFSGRLPVVDPPAEDVYELVYMRAKEAWYATVNGKPLAWNMTTGLYVEAYSWDYADCHREKFWAQHMLDQYKRWKDKEATARERYTPK